MRGFTLIELMVAVTIVAILASIGAVVYSSAQKAARTQKRAEDLKSLQNAIELYKLTTGQYPDAATGACISTALTDLVPNYMPALPTDPSGGSNCYMYQSSDPASGQVIQYKVWTSNTEMTVQEYQRQPALIDPRRDGGTNNTSCTIENGAGALYAWAIYTTPDACAY